MEDGLVVGRTRRQRGLMHFRDLFGISVDMCDHREEGAPNDLLLARCGMTADILTSADAINRHLGARLQQLRRQHRLSLQACGNILDVSYQQIQKYETGANRLSVASLVRLARWFDISPASFFEGLDPAPSSGDPDVSLRSPQERDRLPDVQLTRSIERLNPLSRHRLHALILAIEQDQTRRPAKDPASSSADRHA